jgi:hypothetical protein
MDTIAIIAAAVNLIALGGFAWWIVGWLRSLKGAVDAQKETIAAQEKFIQGLQTVLDATDSAKMLERVEAYKKFVDYEKEVLNTQRERQLEDVAELSGQHLTVIGALMPYVPYAERTRAINTIPIEKGTKESMHRIANVAPELAILQNIGALLQKDLSTIFLDSFSGPNPAPGGKRK